MTDAGRILWLCIYFGNFLLVSAVVCKLEDRKERKKAERELQQNYKELCLRRRPRSAEINRKRGVSDGR